MITALLLMLQVPSYYQLPRADLESERRCNSAMLKLDVFLGQYHSFVTSHERDWGGRLTVDEAVVYRVEADNVARPFQNDIRQLRERPGNGALCEQISADAIRTVTNRVIGPAFGQEYGYEQRYGAWVR